MLRGSHTAKVDDKGRLKIPAAFQQVLAESYGAELYVTSLNGDFVRIYPFEEWSKIEERLARLPSSNRLRRKFLNRTNYFGHAVTMDKQGRVLIPALLRESAGMRGEVTVLGELTYLDVWNHQRFLEEIKKNPVTAEDERTLDELGI